MEFGYEDGNDGYGDGNRWLVDGKLKVGAGLAIEALEMGEGLRGGVGFGRALGYIYICMRLPPAYVSADGITK